MSTTTKKKKRQFFIEGAIAPEMIASSIAKHGEKTNIGAHQIFLGQVRSDQLNNKQVVTIEYTAYKEMAESEISKIREEVFEKFNLVCLHIYHSIGVVKAGGICLFVFASSVHRTDANKACSFVVEAIKANTPIFGKELLEDETYQWKVNS